MLFFSNGVAGRYMLVIINCLYLSMNKPMATISFLPENMHKLRRTYVHVIPQIRTQVRYKLSICLSLIRNYLLLIRRLSLLAMLAIPEHGCPMPSFKQLGPRKAMCSMCCCLIKSHSFVRTA